MNIIRPEIRTGILVVVSISILVFVLLLLGAPGVFTPMNTYYVYFDNAGGINPGAPVMLAGRKVGQVTHIYSPIPQYARPSKAPKDEVLIQVQIARSASIDNNVTVRMMQLTLMGSTIIDFSGGDDASGLAPDKKWFIGERVRGFSESIAAAVEQIQKVIDPLATAATKTLTSLRETSDNLTALTAKGSQIDEAMTHLREVSVNLQKFSGKEGPLFTSLDNIQKLTDQNSHLHHTLENVDKLTTDIVKQNRIGLTLTEFQKAGTKLQNAATKLNSTINQISPQLKSTIQNASQFTDTIKHQPWRLFWPSTKKYPKTEIRRAYPAHR